MIEARVVCDSISPQGIRLTTFKLRYPKFIHGEFMTHRVISRNASSSRAIPVAKLIAEVRDDALRAAPVWWGKNQPGMQANEELDDTTPCNWAMQVYDTPSLPDPSTEKQRAQHLWKQAALRAADYADRLAGLGAHKQIVNRILEPFSHINVVATATEWDNFFGLRLHKDAQPEIRALAHVMFRAREASTPKLLKPGEWHLPFVEVGDAPSVETEHHRQFAQQHCHRNDSLQDIYIKVSVARCARVSVESFETGKRSTVEEDLDFYANKLNLPDAGGAFDGAKPLHASPAEHQATPDEGGQLQHDYMSDNGPCGNCGHFEGQVKHFGLTCSFDPWKHPGQHGNLGGWRQYRKMLPGEAVAPLPEEYR